MSPRLAATCLPLPPELSMGTWPHKYFKLYFIPFQAGIFEHAAFVSWQLATLSCPHSWDSTEIKAAGLLTAPAGNQPHPTQTAVPLVRLQLGPSYPVLGTDRNPPEGLSRHLSFLQP